MCLDHISERPVRLEPAAPRSQVKHSTTEPDFTLAILSVLSIRPEEAGTLV